MKIEKYKPESQRKSRGDMSNALRNLKIGECIRVKTAADSRKICGNITPMGKKLGVKFVTKIDGDDLLVYIQPNP